MTTPLSIPLAKIRAEESTQPRASIDRALVDEYAEALGRGDVFPPIYVLLDGERYWLVDGFHRLAAHAKAGAKTINAIVNDGTRRDAEWQCLAANATHGKRRTRADKQRAIERALMDEEWRKKSDREIARHLHVSDKTVGAHRARLESTAEIPQSDERVGADGRKINTSNIGSNPTSRDEQATSQEEPPARPREDLVSEATPKPSKSAQQAKESNGAEPRQMAIDLRAELARLEREVNALEQKVEDAKRECSVSDSIAETLRQALRRERRKHKEEVERLEQERDLALADAQLWKTTAQHRASLTRHPDQAEIKRDYKRLSRKFHPDAGGTTEEFQALQRLYQAAEGRA